MGLHMAATYNANRGRVRTVETLPRRRAIEALETRVPPYSRAYCDCTWLIGYT